MGCCVSTLDYDNKPLPKQSSLQTQTQTHSHDFPFFSKSPPSADEEAVKEVLSVTPNPILNPNTPSPLLEDLHYQLTKPNLLLLTPNKPYPYPDQNLTTVHPGPCLPDPVSEASDTCSFSETISESTLKEKDDRQMYSKENTTSSGEARQRMHRSHHGYGGNFSHVQSQQLHHYRNQGRSPARRRPNPSPPRKRNLSPGGPRKEFVTGNASSGRRSQSPGMRGSNVAQSPSARRRRPSPGLIQGPVEVEGEEEVGLRRESEEWQGPKESLENPLVSLECFIFL